MKCAQLTQELRNPELRPRIQQALNKSDSWRDVEKVLVASRASIGFKLEGDSRCPKHLGVGGGGTLQLKMR